MARIMRASSTCSFLHEPSRMRREDLGAECQSRWAKQHQEQNIHPHNHHEPCQAIPHPRLDREVEIGHDEINESQ